ncbi:ADP-ribosylglycohydrolase family protein [Streptomyces sp. HUAS TT20]|uniref:ADP-ribosylglycohydrolase family protein n=1 Tax=Streptomyces sp. HUAS TT20 TaxID=3447509 RepID=UPI0021DACDA0|nr:ADP-ribosylglycohydrolase family protein [Streptomyces sp. HUAS 15-9]UXY31940.1 ADP-ribosylglycohydrolase family protein [Streptomyces sp. HUAS 15-9]
MILSDAARDSLEGLALGDAFGERWFPRFRPAQEAFEAIQARRTPEEPAWHWTDDTAMALSLCRVLETHGAVHQDDLAATFAATYLADAARGYGYGMHEPLPKLAEQPSSWRVHTRSLFGGQGSLGNGAAMRVAPLGAWFCDDLEEVAEQAAFSAEVTHAHPEGVAGAVAVAVASALAARSRNQPAPQGPELLRQVAERTPAGPVRDGLREAVDLPAATPPWRAADILGNGQRIRASDTVPFALWSAARHLDSLVDALWTTAEGFGDVDTTCAITGGTVAARTGLAGIPRTWLERRESLPDRVGNVERGTGSAG